MNPRIENCINCAQPMGAGTAFCQTCGAERPSTSEMADTARPEAAAATSPSAQASAPGTGIGLKRLAVLWLLMGFGSGVWLIQGVHTGPVKVDMGGLPSVSTAAGHESYGADAYTGIQNAAADTAQAVVDSTDALTGTSTRLALGTATVNRDLMNRLQQGLGILIIGIGGIPIFVVLTRPSARTPVAS